MNKNYLLTDISLIAKEIISSAKHKILLFYGEMGAGKTTLIKEICIQLNVTDTISSPTFSLVNEYLTTNNEIIYHFDFYRITNEEEAYDIGFENYLENNNLCLIEWPQNVKNLLPLKTVEIHLSILEDGQRNIQLKSNL